MTVWQRPVPLNGDPDIRARAAWMADRQRFAHADAMDEDSARRLLDLQLEGIREAPVGVVVCCGCLHNPVGEQSLMHVGA